ncbi:MAG TPA: hypothetical protein VNO17_12575 [Actinomycetota bacterium]|jgi:hypothetical protein|nr:hypothetical protein [Actinomycetota bacterium]
MRYEFEREGRRVGTALWEGPAQVSVEAEDAATRARLERFFASEVTYMSGGFGVDDHDEALAVRRRDWTPWEFERACRHLGQRLGATVRRVETGPVEERPEEVGAR